MPSIRLINLLDLFAILGGTLSKAIPGANLLFAALLDHTVSSNQPLRAWALLDADLNITTLVKAFPYQRYSIPGSRAPLSVSRSSFSRLLHWHPVSHSRLPVHSAIGNFGFGASPHSSPDIKKSSPRSQTITRIREHRRRRSATPVFSAEAVEAAKVRAAAASIQATVVGATAARAEEAAVAAAKAETAATAADAKHKAQGTATTSIISGAASSAAAAAAATAIEEAAVAAATAEKFHLAVRRLQSAAASSEWLAQEMPPSERGWTEEASSLAAELEEEIPAAVERMQMAVAAAKQAEAEAKRWAATAKSGVRGSET
eukprot:gnl/MRDRNA2_/MRDRNA2_72013_c0_seq1.p1 gnl/MRDRNA2_/MRDRNA2_72013_c0~~gnl/MRDRNA2_/MRDRNA2_72013_c0_seq1.p1  ORF type:complete len:317 (+),score=77.39 gnl/MRDRNA2_/MRDRNA2_72013_c0_seq1:68-1018(+)